jgi:hypothetical protein
MSARKTIWLVLSIFAVSHGRLLVPLRAVSRALGGQMRWDAGTRTAVVRFQDRTLEVVEPTQTVRLDGQALAGPAGPKRVQGQLLVPLAAVERLFGVRGQWLPRKHRLSFVSSGSEAMATAPNGPNSSSSHSGLRLLLSADRGTYPVGTPVRLTFAIANSGPAPVTLQFATSQKYDFEVRRGGQTVWRWSADRMFTQALTSLTLAPGARQTFAQTWKQQDDRGQPVTAGEYEAIATLTTMGRPQPQSAPIQIRITSAKPGPAP